MKTRQQYEKALSIIKEYRNQLIDDLEVINETLNAPTLETKVIDLPFSQFLKIRILNGFKHLSDQNKDNFYELKASCLFSEKYSSSCFIKLRCLGKKSLNEIQNIKTKINPL